MLKPQEFYDHILSLSSANKFLIAYSGGLDSQVLLHLMKTISETSDIKIRALHVNHGLQQEANSWSESCKNTCQEMLIACDLVKLDLDLKAGESIEALAREGRYKALKKSLQTNEVLLTAHHQNDQAETLLLQLFRGAGVDGLASMPKITPFGLGQHMRPLLAYSREELSNYATQNNLDYVEDPSNQDYRFDRNYLRHNIFPLMQKRWLGINKVLARVADIQAETAQVLDELAAEDLQKIMDSSKQGNELSITDLLLLSKPRQKVVLRYWIKKQGFLVPSAKKLQHLFTDVLHAKQDASPLLTWQATEIRRFKNKLFIMSPLDEFDSSQVINWNAKSNLIIPEIDIELQSSELNVLLQSQKITHENSQITVRFRQGGEKLFIDDKSGKVSLKSVLHNAEIPPWLRSRIPLIYLGEQLIHVWINALSFNKGKCNEKINRKNV